MNCLINSLNVIGYSLIWKLYDIINLSQADNHYKLFSEHGLSNTAIKRHIEEIDRQIEHLELEISIVKLQAESNLRRAIYNMFSVAIEIQNAEAAARLGLEQLRLVEVRHQFGRASANDLRIADYSISREQMNLDNLHRTKANAMGGLNNLLSQPPHQQTIVEHEHDMPDISVNIARHIERLVRDAPTIRQLQIDFDRHRLNLSRHEDDCFAWPREDCDICTLLRDTYARARLIRDIETRAMETSLRMAFNQLETLRTQEAAARLSLEQAQKNYETVKTNLELGRVTLFEVNNAAYAVASAERNIEVIMFRQWVLWLSLANPVLLNNR